MTLTYGEYPQAPPPRTPPEFACSFADCTEPGVAQLNGVSGVWVPGFCEKHWRQHWMGKIDVSTWRRHWSKR